MIDVDALVSLIEERRSAQEHLAEAFLYAKSHDQEMEILAHLREATIRQLDRAIATAQHMRAMIARAEREIDASLMILNEQRRGRELCPGCEQHPCKCQSQ